MRILRRLCIQQVRYRAYTPAPAENAQSPQARQHTPAQQADVQQAQFTANNVLFMRFLLFYRYLSIIPFVLRHRPLSCFTKTIPSRWEFCISPSMPPRDDLMPKADMAFFDKNLSLLTAKVWLI